MFSQLLAVKRKQFLMQITHKSNPDNNAGFSRGWKSCRRRFSTEIPLEGEHGSFENEALENEDRSTKHPKLENEAPKTRKRSTLSRKRSTQKTRHRSVLYKHETNVNTAEINQNSKTKHPKLDTSLSFINTRPI